MRSARLVLVVVALSCAPAVLGGERKASIESVAWLTGSWHGSGVQGAPAIEVYSAPAGGQMIGHFRQLKPDGSIMFYELITLSVRDDKLHYRVKHFNPDLSGWEEKAEFREFALTHAGNDRWESGELVIERQARDRMRMTIQVEERSGRAETLVFSYARQ